MKKILVIIDRTPTFYIDVERDTSIKSIKSFLQKYKIKNAKMFLNANSEILIFDSNKYDNMNLNSLWDKIDSPSINIETINKLEYLPADVQRMTALYLSPRDIISLCLSKKSLNRSICDSKDFWRMKIKIDYPRQNIDVYQSDPKKLYSLLTMNSKIVEVNFYIYHQLINNNELIETDNEKYYELTAVNLTKYITKQFINDNLLKRGDVLHLYWRSRYRNDGKFLWDGEKVVVLDYIDDEYGSVPKELAFPEFRPEYFSESIDHNNLVRLTPEKIKEVIDNFDVTTQTTYVTDNYNRYNVKLNTDLSENIEIKFNKIILEDNLEYTDNEFILNIPVAGGGHHTKKKSIHRSIFSSEWKDAIISITSKSPSTTYKWLNDNTLEIETNY